jgi:hypothetical protein
VERRARRLKGVAGRGGGLAVGGHWLLFSFVSAATKRFGTDAAKPKQTIAGGKYRLSEREFFRGRVVGSVQKRFPQLGLSHNGCGPGFAGRNVGELITPVKFLLSRL